eukprot:NODE_1620_length_1469_cov_31.880986_g1462_i0.p1 GENE.NODE_1620_length_1469_cov_31.880986_g1462_i0~~NODE_1620_length_1469_cov_31.880986_g1462_i0.p1  ORF type:complete len:471 (+),score=93.00 NODE_1620_length_1469_cov_31.880986_g1462_i0:66-1415(+)
MTLTTKATREKARKDVSQAGEVPPLSSARSHHSDTARLPHLEAEIELLLSPDLQDRGSEIQNATPQMRRACIHLLEVSFQRDKAVVEGFLEMSWHFFFLNSTVGLRGANLGQLKTDYEQYRLQDKREKIVLWESCQALGRRLEYLGVSVEKDLDSLQQKWLALEESENSYLTAINRESVRRGNTNDRKKAVHKQCDDCLRWLAMQEDKVLHLEPSDVSSFCQGLLENEPKITEIQSQAQELGSDVEIESKLYKMRTTSMRLMFDAHDVLRSHMMKQFSEKKIEEHLATLAPSLSAIGRLLIDCENILMIPSEKQFRKMADPVVERCTESKRVLSNHCKLAEHMWKEFAGSVSDTRTNFDTIRQAISETAGALVIGEARVARKDACYQRRDELNRAVDEVKDWIVDSGQSIADRQAGRLSALQAAMNELLQFKQVLQEESRPSHRPLAAM